MHVKMKKGIKSKGFDSYIDLELPFIRHAYEVHEEALESVDAGLFSLAKSLKSVEGDILLYNAVLERLFVSIKSDHDRFFKSNIKAFTQFVATLETEAGEVVKKARTTDEVYIDYAAEGQMVYKPEVAYEDQEMLDFGDSSSKDSSDESGEMQETLISAENPVELELVEDSTAVVLGTAGIQFQEAFDFETSPVEDPPILAEMICKAIREHVKSKVQVLKLGEVFMKTRFVELDEVRKQKVYDINYTEFLNCMTPNTSSLTENETFLIKYAMTQTLLGNRDEIHIIKAKKCDLTGPLKLFAPTSSDSCDDLYGF